MTFLVSTASSQPWLRWAKLADDCMLIDLPSHARRADFGSFNGGPARQLRPLSYSHSIARMVAQLRQDRQDRQARQDESTFLVMSQ